MAVSFDIVVANPALQRTVYTHIKVYRAPNPTATLVEVTGPATRIPLSDGEISYEFIDAGGSESDYYAVSYFNSRTGKESEKGELFAGVPDPALDIISVEELKKIYLTGVNLFDDKGEPYSPMMFRWYIQAAVQWLEHHLDIPIREQVIVAERHDYFAEQFAKFSFIKLNLFPLISIEEVRLTYPSQPGASRIYPAEWIQPDYDAGTIEIVPSSGALSIPFFGNGGLLMPAVYGGASRYVPHIHEVDYTAGFKKGHVPADIRHVVGMISAFGPLNIAGDLLGGPGIASYSMGLDGLTQAVATTSSPQFAGYGARLWSYTRELKQMLPVLRDYYKGIPVESA